jgi:GYF domain 2
MTDRLCPECGLTSAASLVNCWHCGASLNSAKVVPGREKVDQRKVETTDIRLDEPPAVGVADQSQGPTPPGIAEEVIWYCENAGKRIGPTTEDKLRSMIRGGALSENSLVWTKSFGTKWRTLAETDLFDGPPPLPAAEPSSTDDTLIRRVADYERISGVLWILLGAIQILLIYTAIAGIWNIIAGFSRVNIVKRIKSRDATVPQEFDKISGLVIVAIINLLLGGFIGLLFVAFDFYIRDKIMSNKHLFVYKTR